MTQHSSDPVLAVNSPAEGAPPAQSLAVTGPMLVGRTVTKPFAFDGGAGSFFTTALADALVTIFTLGICYPWAVVMIYRWRAEHTYVNGHRLPFTGSAWGLFGQ
jgi:hypothetical protein